MAGFSSTIPLIIFTILFYFICRLFGVLDTRIGMSLTLAITNITSMFSVKSAS